MQDRPDAREMIEVVASFIEKEINPILTDPRLRFRGLVAANVLNIIVRELVAGDTPTRAEWQRLVPLLGRPDDAPPERSDVLRSEVQALSRDLCARIRADNTEDQTWYDEVFAHAQATVIDKLRIANPRFLERVMGEQRR